MIVKLLEAAIGYARRGWRVIPLNGKAPPYIREWQNKASVDDSQIKSWWEEWPRANVGLAAGSGSGFFVIDVDGDQGAASLVDLETTFGALPKTYEVETARGRHLYFEQPIGMRTKTQASGELGVKIDVRGDGGYVVAPPSVHPETKRLYRVTCEMIPAKAPAWLLDFVRADRPRNTLPDSHQVPIQIPQHARNSKLTSVAGQLRRLGLTTEEMARALLEINIQRCRPPLNDREVLTIAQSIGKKDPARCLLDGTINDAELIVDVASEVTSMPVTWRWPRFLPRGAVVTWSGDPGQGKSTFAFTVAAKITKGESLPGDDCLEAYLPEDVVILSAEDDKKKTIRPRLELAGADLSRVHLMSSLMSDGRPINFPAHLTQLTELIRAKRAALAVIDPLDAFLGEDIDSHKNADVRRTLMPFTAISETTNCIILIISHLNKASQSAAMYRVSGSIAFIAAARAAFVFGSSSEHPDEHVFACLKTNLARPPKPLRYALEEKVIEGLGPMPRIRWLGESETETAATILQQQPMNGGEQLQEREEAKKFLREALKDGPRPAKDIAHEAREMCSQRTLMTAKAEMHIVSRRQMNKWFWALAGYQWGAADAPFNELREPGDE